LATLGRLLDSLLEAVWLVDAQTLCIEAMNSAACALMGGVDPVLVVGQSVTHWAVSPEDMVFWGGLGSVETANLWSESLIRRLDDSTISVERRVNRVTLSDGSHHYLVAMQDRSQVEKLHNDFEQMVTELRATLDSSADGILVCSLSGQVRAYNRCFVQLWGVPQGLQTGRDDMAVYEHLAAQVQDRLEYERRLRHWSDHPQLAGVDRICLRDGRVLERSSVPQLSRGRPMGRVFSYRDITERLANDAKLRLAAMVFECSLDAVFIADAAERLISVNPACAKLVGPAVETLSGETAERLFTDSRGAPLMQDIRNGWAQQGFWEGEAVLLRADGTSVPVQLSWVVLPEGAGPSGQSVGFFRDLTEQHKAQSRIEQLAYSDVLTGLPNRLLLSRRVEFALQLARREQSSFAILFLDLDRFKNINDSLGHQFGDRVLVQVAQRIRSCLRDVDTLCRLGGDEFVLYLHAVDRDGAELAVGRILRELNRPFSLDDMSFSVGCSIGVALYPQDGQSLDELIKQADTAMYEVKATGRGHHRFYRPQMSADVLPRMKLETAMRQALEQGRFSLHYQPQLHLRSGKLIGAEALIRWHDPVRGAVSPGQFIPLAEESGFIVSLGAWVLEEAVRQCVKWLQAGTPVPVSVNVSAMQFRQPDFVEAVAGRLSALGLPPHLLELELTESILVQDADEVLQRLRALSALGVRLAIDDFGTGYSSLAYLKKFPIDKLKIDQSFVRGLPADESDLAIVVAMIGMARALKLSVIAEGVETEAQRSLLDELGCDEYQGFLYSPGVKAESFDAFLQTGDLLGSTCVSPGDPMTSSAKTK
jgi:diguanylate cyclase (GGDEF)-like protein/PAS domain S-box-containing protein